METFYTLWRIAVTQMYKSRKHLLSPDRPIVRPEIRVNDDAVQDNVPFYMPTGNLIELLIQTENKSYLDMTRLTQLVLYAE